MRRILASTVALAMQVLAKPDHERFAHITDGIARDKLISDAQFLAERYGGLLHTNVPPAELLRRSANRRRARQTHPGKRGGQ